MGYGKCWKVPAATLENLIDNKDENGDCLIEVWHDSSDKIADCQLWLNLLGGWADLFPITPPVDPT